MGRPLGVQACEYLQSFVGILGGDLMDDLISRKSAIEVASRECHEWRGIFSDIEQGLKELPSVQTEEAVPHRNYKYLSDFWCECGNHLGKKGDVKYCSDCGKKVKWDE